MIKVIVNMPHLGILRLDAIRGQKCLNVGTYDIQI